jgi:pimeloyl-ACP methyl ester carboxylesterase
MARMVLVHGAFASGWCWDPVVPGLEAAGHLVEVIDLPGTGSDRTPVEEIDLRRYADRVVTHMAGGDESAILVGHSMGGMVITQAAALAPRRLSRLVYVCAFLPHAGQSLLALTQLPEGADDQVQANLVVEGDPPVATMRPGSERDAIFGCCTDEQAAWAIERLGPQPLQPFLGPVEDPDGALADVECAYVVCSRDRAIPPALQRRMIAEHGVTRVVELDTDHAPFLSATAQLVAALHGFAD